MSLSQSKQVPAPIAGDTNDPEHAGVHAVPKRILVGVYAGLMILTAVTVGVSRIDLGEMNIVVALAVAVVKGTLVALFFMHLFWDSRFNAMILISAFFFLAIFIGIALLDVRSYQPNLTAPQAMNIGQ